MDVTEFYAPFAMLPDHLELCRIRSPTHGVFDTVIRFTGTPTPTVYTDEAGLRYMEERYPVCPAFEADELRLEESPDGRRLRGVLTAGDGPVRRLDVTFTAVEDLPRAVAYEASPVWGSTLRCQGVDLSLAARVTGRLEGPGGGEAFDDDGVLTLGSYGHITSAPS